MLYRSSVTPLPRVNYSVLGFSPGAAHRSFKVTYLTLYLPNKGRLFNVPKVM